VKDEIKGLRIKQAKNKIVELLKQIIRYLEN
jgi:hypothetical protein